MEFLQKQITAPANWGTFEDLARALFAAVWNNPLTQKNGRTGQAQHGVDIYGEPNGTPGKWHGVQCKGKMRSYGARATRREFDAELKKADEFSPALSYWVFATTAPNDAPLQKHAREVSVTRIAAGKFPVDVLGWDSLLSLLAQHPKVLRQFYPELVSTLPDDLGKLEAASAAALASIDDSLRHGDTALTLVRPDLWLAMQEALSQSTIVRITGDGGAGKSGLLKRLGSTFDGPRLILKDNRITATSLQQHLAQLGIAGSVESLLQDLADARPALCLIDGADRLLMSDRRGVVTDLFASIARSAARANWTIVTTARSFQDQDLVTTALREVGFEHAGTTLEVGAIDDAEADMLAAAFPAFTRLVERNDLAGQNRSLFLLRELLKYDKSAARSFTEVDIAGTWATAPTADASLSPRRSKALSELGQKLLSAPSQRPARADFDPLGLHALIEEGSVLILPARDTVALAYDVHEDWLLARSLDRERSRLAEVLRTAGEPLWWQRAVRLVGQILLEAEDLTGWRKVLAVIDSASDLDPAWARALLIAPLYSERVADILPRLEEAWLADEAALLKRLIDTLIVFETGIDQEFLESPALAHLDEAQRYTVAAHWKQPILRNWVAFLRWSLSLWETWPANLIPRLAEMAAIFTRATARVPNVHSRAIARICADWLNEIEDAHYGENRNDRLAPFGLDLARHRWRDVEKRLREALSNTVDSAPRTVGAYLERLGRSHRLAEPRGKLIEAPQRIPTLLPGPWVDMCVSHFVPHRRVHRPGPDSLFGPELFPFHSYQNAGIQDAHGFFPSSPLRGGFADLFEADEREALRLLHRMEMRAAVYWRWRNKCQDRRRPIPTVLDLPWGKVTLWGDEAVYRWSRGVLGSHVLGSAYLALDQWMSDQAANGRQPQELVRLALQNNGLVASAAVCIGMLSEHVNTKGAIDMAGPFLAEPRLWQFDTKRYFDDQGSAHRIGFWSPENVHYQAVERLHQRHRAQQPLSHAMLLPFRLMAESDAQCRFEARRVQWHARDAAIYEDELDDAPTLAELDRRIERCRSDGDPSQIEMNRGPEDGQILVSIAPPAAAAEEIAAVSAQQQRLEHASRLANWVNATRERGRLDDALSIPDAIARAKAIVAEFEAEPDMSDDGLSGRIASAGIVGTAAVTAIYGIDELVRAERSWVEHWLRQGARLHRAGWESAVTVDEAILPFDAQVLAAWGLAGMACRYPDLPHVDGIVVALAVQRLHAVTEAAIEGLRWDQRPEFARNVVVTALDSCVIDVGHWWWGDKEKRRAAARTERLRKSSIKRAGCAGAADRAPLFPPAPFERRWIWSWRKLALPRRLKLKSRTVLDWNKARTVLQRIDWARLTKDEGGVCRFAAYLRRLVQWTQAYSEEEAQRYDSQFPYEWGHALARVLGRFAATHGRGNDWQALRSFTYRDRAEELIGEYLEAITHELVESGREPDGRFWDTWRPAAEWIMQRSVPHRRDRNLPQFLQAAGFVGPYMTPLPPDWPYLEGLLGWIDGWVSATCHLPSAAYAVLVIVERMTPDQRLRWFLPWLLRFVERHGADESFWSYDGLGNKAAALVKPLSSADPDRRLQARQCLAIIADAGSPAARELLPLFATPRPAA